MPEEFAKYMHYVRNLGFSEEPDYKYLRWLFQNLFRKEGYDNDGCFDWTIVKGRPRWEVNEIRQKREAEEQRVRREAGLATVTEQPTDHAQTGDVVLSVRSEPG